MPQHSRPFLARAGLATVLALAAAVGAPAALANPPDAKVIDAFVRAPNFVAGKLSPDGAHVAFIVPVDDRAVLAMFSRADLKQVGAFNLAGKTRVSDFWWVSNDRIILEVSEQVGFRDTPQRTGELVGVDVDGKSVTWLTGERSYEDQTGTRTRKRDNTNIYAELVDRRSDKEDQVLIASTFRELDVHTTDIDRLEIDTGIRHNVTRVPVPYASVLADHDGQPRFASGRGINAYQQLWYRAGPNADWQMLNDEGASGVTEFAVGFDAAQSVAYLVRQNKTGPDTLVAYDLASGRRSDVIRDPRVDPSEFLYGHDNQTLLAVGYRDPRPRWHFIDQASAEAKKMQALTKAFPDHFVDVSGVTDDGALALVYAGSDRDSGAYYLFDTAARPMKADELIVRQSWLDPAGMGKVQTVEFTSRDGRAMQALLTVPPALPAGAKPSLVVMPHGGPFGVVDTWEFDDESQLLAAHGFAVLRVNFRGSGGYGREFELAGHRQWGGTMQDDLADATREAIARGLVDRDRICIYGSSYGGYAALMGPVREPGLFKCAAGYVGAYDLPAVLRGDGRTRLDVTRQLVAAHLGDDIAALQASSPVNLAAQVKVPVFLAAAGRDETVAKEQSLKMRDALTAAGNAPEWLMFESEGHGYYTTEHRVELYKRLLAFLDKHLAMPAPATAATH